jgi:hypothetical protein
VYSRPVNLVVPRFSLILFNYIFYVLCGLYYSVLVARCTKYVLNFSCKKASGYDYLGGINSFTGTFI